MAAVINPIGFSPTRDDIRGRAARAAAVRSRARAGRPVVRPPVRTEHPQSVRGSARRCDVTPLVANVDLLGLSVADEPGERIAPAHATARRCAPTATTYRRRRLAAAALLLGALLAGSWVLGALGGGPLAASESGSSSVVTDLPSIRTVATSTYVVAPGDTVWSIARRFQPTGDVRPLVDALTAARSGRALEVGERIALP